MLMRKLLFVIFTVWPGFVLLAQIEPVQNNPEEIKKLGVKMVSVYYYESVDTVGKEPKLALKKEFDAEGKILKKFTTSFWDVVSYSNSTTFKYDKRQQLVEETKLQTILVLENKDQEYIDSFGDAPLNENIQYTYNSYGELIKKEIFIFRTNELSASTEPSQKITYEYDSGLLRLKKSSSPQSRVFNQNFNVEYEYDTIGNLIRTTRTYGLEMDNKQIAEYSYNQKNQLVEEKILDTGIPRNNIHLRYEYDEAGFLQNKLIFDADENEFVSEVSFQYDLHGNKISGEKEVKFTYDENGLIKSELWIDDIKDQVFYFVSTYEFY
jgi:hypothetical protein